MDVPINIVAPSKAAAIPALLGKGDTAQLDPIGTIKPKPKVITSEGIKKESVSLQSQLRFLQHMLQY